jgi:hypothetical protein
VCNSCIVKTWYATVQITNSVKILISFHSKSGNDYTEYAGFPYNTIILYSSSALAMNMRHKSVHVGYSIIARHYSIHSKFPLSISRWKIHIHLPGISQPVQRRIVSWLVSFSYVNLISLFFFTTFWCCILLRIYPTGSL